MIATGRCACSRRLLAAAGASAQSRPSLADRVAALEARVQQNQTEQSVELLNRIAQLESEVKELRALVEQMQNDNQQARDREKAQYIDLDSRLSRIENAAAQPPPAVAGKVPVTIVKRAGRARASRGAAQACPRAVGTGCASTGASAAVGADPGHPVTEKAAYDAAFAAMKAEHYADSANRFNAFVQQYPNSPLAPNAYYWMGESYYVTQNYQLALDAFKAVVTRYPDSPKSPGALLKLGYSQDGLKQRDAAQATLRDVIQKYPNSSEAAEAQSRLRAMSMACILDDIPHPALPPHFPGGKDPPSIHARLFRFDKFFKNSSLDRQSLGFPTMKPVDGRMNASCPRLRHCSPESLPQPSKPQPSTASPKFSIRCRAKRAASAGRRCSSG